MVRVEKP